MSLHMDHTHTQMDAYFLYVTNHLHLNNHIPSISIAPIKVKTLTFELSRLVNKVENGLKDTYIQTVTFYQQREKSTFTNIARVKKERKDSPLIAHFVYSIYLHYMYKNLMRCPSKKY